MQILLEIPDALAAQMTSEGRDPARTALEALAGAAYANGSLSEAQVRRMLGLATRMEVHQFLAAQHIPLRYSEEQLRRDIDASDRLHGQLALASAS